MPIQPSQQSSFLRTSNLNPIASTPFASAHKTEQEDISISVAVLGTVQVRIEQRPGMYTVPFRGFVDPGSQVNLITEDCVQLLGLRRTKVHIPITGIGATSTAAGFVKVKLVHRLDPKFTINVQLLVVTKISSNLPDHPFDMPFADVLLAEEMADPLSNVPGRVDILLGAGAWAQIVREKILRKNLNGQTVIAQSSIFGWIISGQMATCTHLRLCSCHVAVCDDDVQLDKLLLKFWEADAFPQIRPWSAAEQRAEDIFKSTHSRNQFGRYMVRIPLCADPPELGDSKRTAKARFFGVEKKFAANAELFKVYKAVFDDYRAKKHMVLAPQGPIENSQSYYLSHHAINGPGPSTARKKGKFRVVFDPSVPTSNGVCYNDLQLAGPKLQADLGATFLRFRTNRFAVTADIVQMFRQILVDPLDWNYQRVFWRDSPTEPLLEYIITVVTWGMASAGFNSVRALRQCATDHQEEFPVGANAVLNRFYYDDMMAGADTEEELLLVFEQVQALLARGCFEMAKWTSNNGRLAAHISQHQNAQVEFPFEAGVLGMLWLPAADLLCVKIDPSICEIPEEHLTKRRVFSAIAKVYDPNGLVAPIIVNGKILQQDIWRSGIGWDERIPFNLTEKWNQFKQNIATVDLIRIPRWLRTGPGIKLQLHIFTDASEKALGASAYARVIDDAGQIHVSLITSKSKVAPVRRMTIPRLELWAALIGAELYQYVIKACEWMDIDSYFWTDSTIAICWIKRDPEQNKPFVAHKVLAIRQLCNGSVWRHVDGTQNPADLLTRGLSADILRKSDLWFHGPDWLSRPQGEWPIPAITTLTPAAKEAIRAEQKHFLERNKFAEEIGPFVAAVFTTETEWLGIGMGDGAESLIDRHSELSKLLRVTAFVFRFIQNVKVNINKRKENGHFAAARRTYGQLELVPFINTSERRKALLYWVRLAQYKSYAQEIKCCTERLPLPKNSKLIKLLPHLDTVGLLRVGGRLSKANIPEDAKHQLILPPKARISHLLIRDAHYKTVHGGPQLMMAFLRRSFWITRFRQIIKSVVHNCTVCIRYEQSPGEQLMGDLPADRVNETEPFLHTGVDFAGPFNIKKSPGRPASARNPNAATTTTKAWIVIFVCMATRAVHIDVVAGLTIEDFLGAFERFIMRKGRCAVLHSDNGTNFVGSDNELKRVLRSWAQRLPEQQLANFGTRWKFIAPAAPHKGGLWEAAVRSMKRHLRRTIGKRQLDKDELYHIAVQIEGCLNSRPLWPLTDDPTDVAPLTPAHFILGKSILLQPLSEDVSDTPSNRLTIWGRRQQLLQQIWRRWRDEYIADKQQRTKWYSIKENLKVGDLVVIRNENLPPAIWCLGRVIKAHKAADGLVRAALVKTATGELERPINKLCVLVRAGQNNPVDQVNGGV